MKAKHNDGLIMNSLESKGHGQGQLVQQAQGTQVNTKEDVKNLQIAIKCGCNCGDQVWLQLRAGVHNEMMNVALVCADDDTYFGRPCRNWIMRAAR